MEEGGDLSVVCKGPAPCVRDSCVLMIWLGGAGVGVGGDIGIYVCFSVARQSTLVFDIMRCYRTGMPVDCHECAAISVQSFYCLALSFYGSAPKCEILCFVDNEHATLLLL